MGDEWHKLADIELLILKNPAFVDEREARMIFEVRPRWKFVHHRAGRDGMTPFIELSADTEENNKRAHHGFLQQPGRLPIKSVMIGPTLLGDEVVSAAEEFLESNGYPNVTVKRSEISLRSRSRAGAGDVERDQIPSALTHLHNEGWFTITGHVRIASERVRG